MTATDELRRMVKLVRRYPDSKTEDITDAFNRGVICGMEVCRGTCHDVGKGWMWRCSECGCRLDIDRDYLPTMWVDGMADVPRFCPNCGRRVAS